MYSQTPQSPFPLFCTFSPLDQWLVMLIVRIDVFFALIGSRNLKGSTGSPATTAGEEGQGKRKG